MNERVGHSRRSLLWITMVIAVLMLAGVGIWLATAPSDSAATDNTQTSPITASATSPNSSATTPSLDPQCAEKADPPANGAIEVVDKAVTIDDDETAFEFYLRHDTDLIAIHVTFDVQFMKDGEDVTDQLGQDFDDVWSDPYADVSPNVVRLVDRDSLKTPDGWTQDNITLNVTLGSVEYWCTPKEAE